MTDPTDIADPDGQLPKESEEEALRRIEELRAEHHEAEDTNIDDLDEP